MKEDNKKTIFKATLLRPVADSDALCAFVVLPKSVSEKLPRRGRTTVEGTINGHAFQVTLEPDGKLSHWLPISKTLFKAAGLNLGDTITLEIMPVEQEPEPEIPADLQRALAASPAARAVWNETTTIARVDWIHWIVSAKQSKTRAQRIATALDKLTSGERRVCCFDPSGFYSKALSAPKTK
jgi:hypothetical protein